MIPSFRPRRALILAAGLGTRLRPLTWKTPKPLMTLWGEPLIDHAVALLQRWGVEEMAINTHWHSELLASHLAHRWPETEFRISHEPEILGTGGALLPLRDFLEAESAFWIFNADIVASLDADQLLLHHEGSEAFATLWLTPDRGPRTVETDTQGRIASFRSRTPGTPGTLTFTGVHLVSGDLYRYLDSTLPASIVTAYERALADGRRVCGFDPGGTFWADCGTPEAMLAIHQEVRERSRDRRPGGEYYRPERDRPVRSCIARTASVASTAHVEDSVIGEQARILDSVRLRHCIVGSRVTVHHNAQRAVLARPEDFEDERVNASIAVLGWPAEATTVEALEARGSDRAFFRIAFERHRAILSVYGATRTENARYAGHAIALRQAGVPVPGVLAHAPEARWLVLEDLGEDDLLGRVRTLPPEGLEELYETVLDSVIRLHQAAPDLLRNLDMEPAFDATVYRWEHELFAEHLLRRRLHTGESSIAAVLEELAGYSRPLEDATRVVVHRDLQSSNLLFRNGRAHLIDFQGMRPGPAAYDLAALLCDPYAGLPRELRHTLLHHYAARVPWGADTRRIFPVAVVQRLVQAIGAYARLASIPGTERFAQHIRPAARMLLEEASGLPDRSELLAIASQLAGAGDAERVHRAHALSPFPAACGKPPGDTQPEQPGAPSVPSQQ